MNLAISPEHQTSSNNTREKRAALERMNLAMTQFTSRLISGTVTNVDCPRTYQCVYNAIFVNDLYYEWFWIMRSSAEKIIVKFRNNRIEYTKCASMMRDVSLWAETRSYSNNDNCRVRRTFDRVWNQWHSDKELRVRLLWGMVRAMRVKTATLAWLLKTYEEVLKRRASYTLLVPVPQISRAAQKRMRGE
jgi:hypothetical protein